MKIIRDSLGINVKSAYLYIITMRDIPLTQNLGIMKTSTLKKRLQKRYTESKTAKAYQIVSDLINGTDKTYCVNGNFIRPVYTSGSGRFVKNMDYTKDVARLLTLLGVKFEPGNDAPRGGLTGNYIKIQTKITQD